MASSTSSLPRHERMPTWVMRLCSGPRPSSRADGAAVHVGMKAREVGAGVDHLDLVAGHAGGDEAPLDRLADGDDGGDAPVRVAEAVPAVEREADAAVQDEHGDLDEEAGDQRERPRPALLAVDDVDALARGSAARASRRDGEIDLAAHRERRVGDARRARTARPRSALGRVPTTTWWPRAWSPQASSRSWMAGSGEVVAPWGRARGCAGSLPRLLAGFARLALRRRLASLRGRPVTS